MKVLRYLLALSAVAGLSYANMKFAPSSDCKSCHPLIYKEFSDSMHSQATPSKDPIHKAVWDRHPKNKKAKKYVCGKCHTPTADNLGDMLAKGPQAKGVVALPDANNKTHQASISCAYCHRIDAIQHGKMSNKNIISKKAKHYYGTMKDAIKSEYHTSSSTNKNFLNGNVCMGCHSHKANKAGLNVCSTNDKNEIDGANCVSCHMPKVSGSVSTQRDTKRHTFHGFPGAHFNQEMLADYIGIEILQNINDFDIAVNNKSPHAMLLHPLRLAQMRVVIIRGDKEIKLKPHTFVRVIGKDGKPTPPWIADSIVKDSMVHGNEKRVVKYQTKLQKGDKVVVHLGHFLVKPKALKKFGLDKTEIATKFYTLKKETFTIK